MAFLLGIIVGALCCYMGIELGREYLKRRAQEQRRQRSERLAAALAIRVNQPSEVERRLNLVHGYDDGFRPAG